ncbi:hypothetical protein Syun_023930 [Stephania yunnanensis]|uniref:Peptidase S9A N-terminal domain-containing protein n=1 Tax=Stephania yunnanensis TaxID=152371 RepID=A0AAP0FQP8_9MAGN
MGFHASSSSSTPLLPLRRFAEITVTKPTPRPQSSISSSSSSSSDSSSSSSHRDRRLRRFAERTGTKPERIHRNGGHTTPKRRSSLRFDKASARNSTSLADLLRPKQIEEGKQYPVLCRRSADLNEEFVSFNSPSAGFDFMAGKRIEQKLLDYNQEAERFGGYSYEELSEVSPDHRFLAYTMYNKDNDSFRLSVRDLSSGSLCSKPDVERVANLAWTKNGQALLYTMTNKDKRPNRLVNFPFYLL